MTESTTPTVWALSDQLDRVRVAASEPMSCDGVVLLTRRDERRL